MSDAIEVQLSGKRGSFRVDVELCVPAFGVTVLFGPSGSGKTTLLRAIAGLERLQGLVRFRDQVWQSGSAFLAPERRRIGYVFQDATLFPHLSVEQNLRYASARADRPRISLEEATHWAGIQVELSRRPSTLSGGEKQRVAIARALLSSPDLLLMDEPLASLDLFSRASILTHLARLRSELEIPLLYVTHSIEEAVRLGDHLVWLDSGRARAAGGVSELLGQFELAAALGDEAGAAIRARVGHHDETDQLTELASSWGPLFVARLDAAQGEAVQLRIRASDVSITLGRESASSILNVLPARIDAIEDSERGQVLLRLLCPSDPSEVLLARITQRSAGLLGLVPGLPVFACIKSVSVR